MTICAETAKAKNVAVFNVKFSENLGDGLIAETIEKDLQQCRGIGQVVTRDLAGRQEYGTSPIRNRAQKLRILGMLPPAMRRLVVQRTLSARLAGLKDDWRKTVAAADHVVIGGGHLFQDDDLNFPSKIGALLDICAEAGTPVSVFAVGVTAKWSKPARDLFGRLTCCRVASVSVRDAASQSNWSRHFRGTSIEVASICLDPVLGMPSPTTATDMSKPVGLCITHPRLIAHHTGFAPPRLLDVFVDATVGLCAAGHNVLLFTNGAQEDEEALGEVISRNAIAPLLSTGRVRKANRPRTPSDLAATIAGMSGLVAHRLHANIAAYAFGIPSVGLGWDEKVQSFFEVTKRSHHFMPIQDLNSTSIVETLGAALEEGIDQETRTRILSEAKDDLRGLGSLIIAANAARSWKARNREDREIVEMRLARVSEG